MATEDSHRRLCKHPYVTAFLDVHFSSMEQLRAQMKDSLAHLVMMTLVFTFLATVQECPPPYKDSDGDGKNGNQIISNSQSPSPKLTTYPTDEEPFLKHKYVLIIGGFLLLLVGTFDMIAFLGMHTSVINKWFVGGTLVVNKKRKHFWQGVFWQRKNWSHLYQTIVHLLGYLIMVVVLSVGYRFRIHKKMTEDQLCEKDQRDWWRVTN